MSYKDDHNQNENKKLSEEINAKRKKSIDY